LRIEHHWASPDPIKFNPGSLKISDYRYFSVDGIWESNFSASAAFFVDGRSTTSGGEGRLDFDLLRSGEDSLVLLYRKGTNEDWKEFPKYNINNLLKLTDRYARITIDSLVKGEYAIAKGVSTVGVKSINGSKNVGKVVIYPNPTDFELNIEVHDYQTNKSLKASFYDVNGKLIQSWMFKDYLLVNTDQYAPGTYVITVEDDQVLLTSEKVVVK